MRPPCELEGCDRPARRRCDGLHVCGGHGTRWDRHRDFAVDVPLGRPRSVAELARLAASLREREGTAHG